jgi:hypothetical protein
LNHLVSQSFKMSVGYNLQDHVSSGGIYYTLTDTAQVANLNQRIDQQLQYIQDGKGPLSSIGVLQVNAFGRSQYARAMGDYPDIQYSFESEIVIRNLTTGLTSPVTNNGTVPPGETCAVAPITQEPFCYYNHIIARPMVRWPCQAEHNKSIRPTFSVPKLLLRTPRHVCPHRGSSDSGKVIADKCATKHEVLA